MEYPDKTTGSEAAAEIRKEANKWTPEQREKMRLRADQYGVFQREIISQDDHIRSQLRQLALEYHYQCEMFDRSVCSGSNKGIAMPMRNRERDDCNANAKRASAELYDSYVTMLGVSPQDRRNAISDHLREFEKQFRNAKLPIPPHAHSLE